MGNKGYLYYICGYVRYVDSSVELPLKWCNVVYLCQHLLDVLPPSTVPRGRSITEGMVNVLRSYNPVVLLLSLWTCVLCLFYILQSNGDCWVEGGRTELQHLSHRILAGLRQGAGAQRWTRTIQGAFHSLTLISHYRDAASVALPLPLPLLI